MKIECYLPASSLDEEQTVLSKPIQLVHMRNWYITKNSVYFKMSGSDYTMWEHRLRRQDDSMVPSGFPITGLLLISFILLTNS